jgi:hypothetical protein
MRVLEDRLSGEGFRLKTEGVRLTAAAGSSRVTVLRSGLAWSSGDLQDLLAPAVPELLRMPAEAVEFNPYFAAKRLRGVLEAQFFTRMEGLGLWTALRKERACGLTPDEKLAVSRTLKGTKEAVECVTDYPTEGGEMFQVGKYLYYRSLVPAAEFISRLRTVSHSFRKNCYLPRSSVVRVKAGFRDEAGLTEETGEWCFLRFSPKSL